MPVPPRSPTSDRIEASVQIRRPPSEVFAFYRDFRNLPRFLGDVMAVAPFGARMWRWTIQGPFGVRAPILIRLTEERRNALIRYESVGLPGLKTVWELRFSQGTEPGSADVHETMSLPLGKLGRAGLALIGKSPRGEVSANLHRLKQLLETGTVSDTSFAVPGKFSRPSTPGGRLSTRT